MMTRFAINICSGDVLLPRETATVACTVFVSCELVNLQDGVLTHTGIHYAVPTQALEFFSTNVQDEQWSEDAASLAAHCEFSHQI
jgi:hypothetical protein